MKAIALMVMLFLATPVFAAELTEGDVKAFLSEWLEVQNSGSFSRYAEMYSETFTGIRRSGKVSRKFDRDGWLKDRRKMFSKPMMVQVANPKIETSGVNASITLEQTWRSGTYTDTGEKVLEVAVDEQGKIGIVREEMINSTKIEAKNTSILSSKFTSVSDKDCKTLTSMKNIIFFGTDSIAECPAPKGWRLFKEYDGEGVRSWLRLGHGNSIWTTVDQVFGDEAYSFGVFPNVGSSYVEWRINNSGEPRALIFKITAQPPDSSSELISRMYILKLHDHVPFFCGITKTIEAARVMADSSQICTIQLPKSTLQK